MRKRSLAAITVCLLSLLRVHAQMPGAGPGNIAFLRIFDQHKAFSATADMTISGTQNDSMNVTFGLTLSDNNVRFEVDMANAKGSMISPEIITQMKAVGMDRVTSIMRMDRKRLYIIYPGLKGYADMVIPDESAQSLGKNLKVNRAPQGKETVGSHSCTKVLLTFTDDKGRSQTMTSWEASDLKGFPVQAQMVENGQNIMVKIRDVKLNRPDTKLFEPPSGYKKYDDIQTLMTQGMARQK
jgi:hypothetical protein